MSDGIRILLEGVGATEYIPQFTENEINLNNLSDLTESDLIALGVDDTKLRKTVMKHVEAKPNKKPKSQYLPVTTEYTKNILSDMNRHMLKLESTLFSTYLQLNKSKQLEDPLVSLELYSSEATRKSMKIINKNLNEMEKQLNELELTLKKY